MLLWRPSVELLNWYPVIQSTHSKIMRLGNPRITLNMQNCFKDYKRCIHILHHILDFIQQKKIKLTVEQPYMLSFLLCQYHACWCPGDLSRQGISRHGICQITQNISSLTSEELPNLIVSNCSLMMIMIGYQDDSSSSGHQVICPVIQSDRINLTALLCLIFLSVLISLMLGLAWLIYCVYNMFSVCIVFYVWHSAVGVHLQ